MSTPPRKPSDVPPKGGGATERPAETCDLCGSAAVAWRNCKLICMNCRAIVKSCSDL